MTFTMYILFPNEQSGTRISDSAETGDKTIILTKLLVPFLEDLSKTQLYRVII